MFCWLLKWNFCFCSFCRKNSNWILGFNFTKNNTMNINKYFSVFRIRRFPPCAPIACKISLEYSFFPSKIANCELLTFSLELCHVSRKKFTKLLAARLDIIHYFQPFECAIKHESMDCLVYGKEARCYTLLFVASVGGKTNVNIQKLHLLIIIATLSLTNWLSVEAMIDLNCY